MLIEMIWSYPKYEETLHHFLRPENKFQKYLSIDMITEVCASCSAGVETEPRSGSSGSASWCEGDAAEERGYGSGDSLAEDAALLGDSAQVSLQPRIMRNQRRDVAVDLHLLRPDVWVAFLASV